MGLLLALLTAAHQRGVREAAPSAPAAAQAGTQRFIPGSARAALDHCHQPASLLTSDREETAFRTPLDILPASRTSAGHHTHLSSPPLPTFTTGFISLRYFSEKDRSQEASPPSPGWGRLLRGQKALCKTTGYPLPHLPPSSKCQARLCHPGFKETHNRQVQGCICLESLRTCKTPVLPRPGLSAHGRVG